MRHIKLLDGLNKAVEEFGYAIGEAADFIDREEPNFCDLIDGVAFGQVSSSEAKCKVHEIFAKARKDVQEWQGLRASVARENGHPYLHESLRTTESMPFLRVVAFLPDSGKPGEARPSQAPTLFGPTGESA